MELKELLKQAHEACEEKEGYLSKMTLEELEKINERNTKDCDYCPFEDNCNICGGTADMLFYTKCYECNKCGKWSISEEELIKATNQMLEEEYGL